ncbi:unnamed protein product [Schistosoma turkestanicum]|nr:unnamed protein product [Schistosoma turkestanicum]
MNLDISLVSEFNNDDDINEKNHDFYNELNGTTNNTTENNIDYYNSQSVSNASSLELLSEFIELEQFIPSFNNNNQCN